jgi:hypothetical protein
MEVLTVTRYEPPCRPIPQTWDLGQASLAEVLMAKTLCQGCAVFSWCRQLILNGRCEPRELVMAGQAYDHMGRVIEDDERLTRWLKRRDAIRARDVRSLAG